MPGVTKEQIQAAREADLFTYLQFHEPGVLKRDGPNFRHKEHDSLVYVTGKRYWYWNSRGRSINALDYLIQIRGYGLVDAVHALVGGEIRHTPAYRSTAEIQVSKRTGKESILSPLGQTLRDRCGLLFAETGDQLRSHSPVFTSRDFLRSPVSWRTGLCICRER